MILFGGMKKGLVLEGGGMRGLFTAGILDEMMENGIQPDGLIGVSAGATICDSRMTPVTWVSVPS